jgi:nucleolar protein 9
MPREQRKRGKKKPKHDKVEVELKDEPVAIAQHDGPSWVRTVPDAEMNPEAPFGFVDPDVKAYFRTVDVKLREWQEEPRPHAAELEEGADPNEGDATISLVSIDELNVTPQDRRIFLVAALSEMVEKELQLSTDPDCSPIIERMAYSMDDFVRRVFMDKLAGS